MTSERAAGEQGGLTLIELMVVVAIVGILMAVAVITIRRDPTPGDVAARVGNLLRETSRKAVSGGAVHPAVAPTFGMARTRMRIFTDGSGNEVVTLERLVDPPPPGAPAWEELTRRTLGGTGIDVAGSRRVTDFDGGVGPADLQGSGDTLVIQCFPDGTCDPCVPDGSPDGICDLDNRSLDALTIYFEKPGGALTEKARITMLPISVTPILFDGW